MLRNTSALLIFILILSSCAKKIDCRNGYLHIGFSEFSKDEIDTVIIKTFTDDSFNSITKTDTSQDISLYNYATQAYEIILLNTPYKYRISKIVIRQNKDTYSRANHGNCFNAVDGIYSDSTYYLLPKNHNEDASNSLTFFKGGKRIVR
jgi:hypothetical protein